MSDVYYKHEKLDPSIFTPLTEDERHPLEKTEFTEDFIMEKFTPFLLQNVDILMDEKFSLLYDRLTEHINEQFLDFKSEIETEAPNVILIEEMTKEDAKEKIIEFFKNYDEKIYPSEISEKLHMSYELVWEILKELDEEGIIRTGD